MIALIQRVSHASVVIDKQKVGEIDRGILALIGVQKSDSTAQVERLLERILSYRIFPDEEGRMNRSLSDIKGGLLLVPQFTLAADTKKGTRPGFSPAAAPELGEKLFLELIEQAKRQHHDLHSGIFGADMKISLCNDGPVTFWLEAKVA